ncbi:hypothetical protein BJ944DRAFT_256879 [Cunninghamella echinulata]|nr:hypothetical protein BJ944DRAFT_256879 [Cunninghamella echinulata]
MHSTNDSHPTSTCIIYEKKTAIGFILIPFAIAGVLIRIALQRLEAYDGAPVFPLVYAQWVGCFIMGIVTTQKTNIMIIYHPLQLGLSTGLCGSITTFSSWQLSIFSSFANIENYDHTRGKNILSALSQLLVTLAMSINGFQFGGHIGQCQQIPKLDIIPCGFSINKLIWKDYTVIFFGLLSWIAVIIAAIFAPLEYRELTLATVFSPVGALLRWHLSFFNGKFPGFPIGTFIANIFGTLVLAILSLFRYNMLTSPFSCISEITNLNLRQKYLYGSISVILGQCIMFVVLGSFVWTHGVNIVC